MNSDNMTQQFFSVIFSAIVVVANTKKSSCKVKTNFQSKLIIRKMFLFDASMNSTEIIDFKNTTFFTRARNFFFNLSIKNNKNQRRV